MFCRGLESVIGGIRTIHAPYPDIPKEKTSEKHLTKIRLCDRMTVCRRLQFIRNIFTYIFHDGVDKTMLPCCYVTDKPTYSHGITAPVRHFHSGKERTPRNRRIRRRVLFYLQALPCGSTEINKNRRYL